MPISQGSLDNPVSQDPFRIITNVAWNGQGTFFWLQVSPGSTWTITAVGDDSSKCFPGSLSPAPGGTYVNCTVVFNKSIRLTPIGFVNGGGDLRIRASKFATRLGVFGFGTGNPPGSVPSVGVPVTKLSSGDVPGHRFSIVEDSDGLIVFESPVDSVYSGSQGSFTATLDADKHVVITKP